ncbi:hypothetical protein [Ferrimonas futtsuensis]|uniref:hypothetical protein n=1 Tax=Ferrimonas futtsuensis TaxID=364764 RepID=UPI00048976D9|nr:hypothetical protein [Ferrimonas futtsuensis]
MTVAQVLSANAGCASEFGERRALVMPRQEHLPFWPDWLPGFSQFLDLAGRVSDVPWTQSAGR